jgi:hypothetical protein
MKKGEAGQPIMTQSTQRALEGGVSYLATAKDGGCL